MSMTGLSGIRLAPDLLAATDDLVSVVVAATEIGAERVEPSHVLVALARIPGGLTARLMRSEGISADILVESLRAETTHATDASGPPGWTGVADAVLSDEARAWRDTVAAVTDVVDERVALAAAIDHLEPAATRLLEEFGGVDLAAWRRAAAKRTTAVRPAFDEDGHVVPARFDPAAWAVLDVLRTEAVDGGHQHPGTLLLLYAMAVTPQGLIEQAAVFQGFDLRELRTRAAILLRRGTRRPARSESPTSTTDVLSTAVLSEALRVLIERAASLADERIDGTGDIGEHDLLEALLDVPSGTTEAVLRASGVDAAGLRRFAEALYLPSAEGSSSPRTESTATVATAVERFEAALIGQPDAVRRLSPVVETIKRAVRRGFRIGERPLATLLFCGPSGTGKTMTARLLAEAIHGSGEELIVFEMGQFNTRESISTFVGAPPGYVGFGEGQLTNGLARKPRCVLLFDEVEKAHPLVLDALLRLLDQGRINDPAGPVRDARETVVVLTSNLGAGEFAELTRERLHPVDQAEPTTLSGALDSVLGPRDGPAPDGTDPNRTDGTDPDGRAAPDDETRTADGSRPDEELRVRAWLREILLEFFRPEFLNRIDEIVLFAPFGHAELLAIARAALDQRARGVRDGLGVVLHWADDVPAHLAAAAARDRAEEAARGVNRSVDALLVPVLRALDEAEERGASPERLRLVVRDGGLGVVVDE